MRARGSTELLIRRVSEELVRQFNDEVTVFTTDCYDGEGFFTPDAPRCRRVRRGARTHRRRARIRLCMTGRVRH